MDKIKETMTNSNKIYDTLKFIALIVEPVITFFVALLVTWNAPYQEQIIKTLAAVQILIGGLVVAMKNWYDEKNGNDEENI